MLLQDFALLAFAITPPVKVAKKTSWQGDAFVSANDSSPENCGVSWGVGPTGKCSPPVFPFSTRTEGI
jgi:hypothetical protein